MYGEEPKEDGDKREDEIDGEKAAVEPTEVPGVAPFENGEAEDGQEEYIE